MAMYISLSIVSIIGFILFAIGLLKKSFRKTFLPYIGIVIAIFSLVLLTTLLVQDISEEQSKDKIVQAITLFD